MVQPLRPLPVILSHLSHSKHLDMHKATLQIKSRTRITKTGLLLHFFITVQESLSMRATQTHLNNSAELGYVVSQQETHKKRHNRSG